MDRAWICSVSVIRALPSPVDGLLLLLASPGRRPCETPVDPCLRGPGLTDRGCIESFSPDVSGVLVSALPHAALGHEVDSHGSDPFAVARGVR